jgi:hypothetical protein
LTLLSLSLFPFIMIFRRFAILPFIVCAGFRFMQNYFFTTSLDKCFSNIFWGHHGILRVVLNSRTPRTFEFWKNERTYVVVDHHTKQTRKRTNLLVLLLLAVLEICLVFLGNYTYVSCILNFLQAVLDRHHDSSFCTKEFQKRKH